MKLWIFKNFSFFSALFFSYTSLQANTSPLLNATFHQNFNNLIISVETQDDNLSLCPLEATALTIKKAKPKETIIGRIDVTFEVKRGAPCFRGLGKRKGQIKLQKGDELPNITTGNYEVYVNNTYVGMITTYLPDLPEMKNIR
jgi:hypothetical protein